ncbi:uncharacterized protein L199_000984 [Kwoniella botswanensis]|uniref:uncharacterized protein n=1 Tax=Kwoniella botswanensis TaxID=1268659 RepID=UPI00315CDDFB
MSSSARSSGVKNLMISSDTLSLILHPALQQMQEYAPSNHRWLVIASKNGRLNLTESHIDDLTADHSRLIVNAGGSNDFDAKTADAETINTYTDTVLKLKEDFEQAVKPFESEAQDQTSSGEHLIIQQLEHLVQSKDSWDPRKGRPKFAYDRLVSSRLKGNRLISWHLTRNGIGEILNSNVRIFNDRLQEFDQGEDNDAGIRKSLMEASGSCEMVRSLLVQLKVKASEAELHQAEKDLEELYDIRNPHARSRIDAIYHSGFTCEDTDIGLEMLGGLRLRDVVSPNSEFLSSQMKSLQTQALDLSKMYLHNKFSEKKVEEITVPTANELLSPRTVENMKTIVNRYKYKLDLEAGTDKELKLLKYVNTMVEKLLWEQSLWKSQIGSDPNFSEGFQGSIPCERFEQIVNKLESERADKTKDKLYKHLRTLEDENTSIIKSAEMVASDTMKKIRKSIEGERDTIWAGLKTIPEGLDQVRSAMKTFAAKADLDLMEVNGTYSQETRERVRENFDGYFREYSKSSLAKIRFWTDFSDELPALLESADVPAEEPSETPKEASRQRSEEISSGPIDHPESADEQDLNRQSRIRPGVSWASIVSIGNGR